MEMNKVCRFRVGQKRNFSNRGKKEQVKYFEVSDDLQFFVNAQKQENR